MRSILHTLIPPPLNATVMCFIRFVKQQKQKRNLRVNDDNVETLALMSGQLLFLILHPIPYSLLLLYIYHCMLL